MCPDTKVPGNERIRNKQSPLKILTHNSFRAPKTSKLKCVLQIRYHTTAKRAGGLFAYGRLTVTASYTPETESSNLSWLVFKKARGGGFAQRGCITNLRSWCHCRHWSVRYYSLVHPNQKTGGYSMCANLIIHKSSTFQNVSYENNEKLSASAPWTNWSYILDRMAPGQIGTY